MVKRELDGRLPKRSFFLLGPRQVGKSTLLDTLDARLSVDLLNPETRLEYIRRPSLLAERARAVPENATIVIDEVQRAPDLLDVVQQLMRERPRQRFVLSGSSARKLRRGAANLLGGRASVVALHPLTCREMGRTFDLGRVLALGTLPPVHNELERGDQASAREVLRAYAVTYMTEEVHAEALVRNLQGFQSFLEVAAAQFAEQVNLSAVARDCGVSYATVRDYYAILEDTMLGFTLRPFVKGVRKRMTHWPRFYFFDNGVLRALQHTLGAEPTPLERGRLFEQWFVQEVRRLSDYAGLELGLSFWRTSHGAEVDLLVERHGKLVAAIECKHKTVIGSADLTGLRSLRDSFPKVPCYVVAPVRHAQQLDFALVVSPVELLARLGDGG